MFDILPMDRIRWVFALPDPKEDVSHKTDATLALERYYRQKDSPLWRFIWQYEAWWQSLHDTIYRAWKHVWHATLGRWVYIKCAHGEAEVAAMRFIASRTSIPVPRVWMCLRWKGRYYIFMSRIRGVELVDAWERLSEETKGVVAEQIRGYVSQLRALPPPAGLQSICSVLGGPVRCFRLHNDATTGPFRDEEHMNLQLRHLRPIDGFPAIVRTVHARRHPLVFTHNDLFPRNIMIEEMTGRVLAILDWESAGWFPAHWEYCKTFNWGDWRPEQREWKMWVPRMIPVYEEEAEADRVLMYEADSLYLAPYLHA